MTREEAIAIIENEKECVNRANKNDYCNRDCYNCELVKTDTEILTALDMAIKALEQEPCDDMIDRAEAMTEIMMFAGNVKSDEEDVCIKVSDVVQLLRELPPVTPTRKKGKWIVEDSGNYNGKWSTCYCSNCKDYYTRAWRDMKYCPHCGAEMQEVEHE